MTLTSFSLSQNSQHLQIIPALHSLHLLSYHRSEEVSAHRPGYNHHFLSHQPWRTLSHKKAMLICVTRLQSLTSHFAAARATFTNVKQVSVREDHCQAKCVAYHIPLMPASKTGSGSSSPVYNWFMRFSQHRRKVFPRQTPFLGSTNALFTDIGKYRL